MFYGNFLLLLRNAFLFFYIQPSESKQHYDNLHIHLPRAVCLCVFMYMCLCKYVCTYVRMYICMYVCVCTYVCVCKYVCMYTYTHTRSRTNVFVSRGNVLNIGWHVSSAPRCIKLFAPNYLIKFVFDCDIPFVIYKFKKGEESGALNHNYPLGIIVYHIFIMPDNGF